MAASSSACSATLAESFISNRPRSAALTLLQTASWHCRAACTAASMSCALLRWISSNTCPSDGSITGIVRPDEEGVEALAM